MTYKRGILTPPTFISSCLSVWAFCCTPGHGDTRPTPCPREAPGAAEGEPTLTRPSCRCGQRHGEQQGCKDRQGGGEAGSARAWPREGGCCVLKDTQAAGGRTRSCTTWQVLLALTSDQTRPCFGLAPTHSQQNTGVQSLAFERRERIKCMYLLTFVTRKTQG